MSFPIDHHLLQLADLLQSQNAILCTHPNDLDLSTLPDSWTVPPRSLLDYYMTGALDAKASDKIPDDLKNLLDSIRTLQLPRSPLNISEHWLVSLESTKGMSPKKIHEVRQMASYIKALVELNSGFRNPHHPDVPLHIVDVGSGQGYLTRTLASLFPDARVLALDADEGQTIGAELKLGKENKRHPSANTNPRITHKTVLITPRISDKLDVAIISCIQEITLSRRSFDHINLFISPFQPQPII
ncbi:histone acetyltransferase mst2 [Coprinopsis cinerea AmutBmut pab1-1]|nr:histone acetyltransferase mst2 [Coprinopsis cinerea AmutBmut pab1-1]